MLEICSIIGVIEAIGVIRRLENLPVRFKKEVWQALNQISDEMLMGEGRMYGGGLHKLEPTELGNAPLEKILNTLSE